ncbi:MAG: acylase [Planctomycetes bacterium B3_Pla]|nr:MAG: acylase [Planctomycetes bacterium B3_Pla]
MRGRLLGDRTMSKRWLIHRVLLFGVVLSNVVALAADQAKIQPTLHMVPMRDGTKLATDVYLPPDGQPPYPVILMRTPYGRGGAAGEAQKYCRRGYAIVSQDIRGRGKSEGHHAIIFHNGGWGKRRDGHDTLLWIASQPWCNGKVATFGGSAVGVTQNMLAPGAPDVLKGQAVVVAFSDMYSQAAYQGGVWRKSLLEGWLTLTGMADVNLKTFRDHPNYDEFWAGLNPEDQAHRVNAPGVFIGGWYDIFLQGTINSFVAIHNHGGPDARGRCRLVIGPIAHGVFDELKYPPNSKMPPAAEASRLFDSWLKGKDNGAQKDKAVHYYVMGDPTDGNAGGNFWRQADNWPPPAEVTAFYFHPDRRLVRETPPDGTKTLSYRYDPNDPVPTVGGQNLLLPKGPMDQRKIESRPDVLLFTSDVLAEPVEVTGRISAKLYVSSDRPDTDFTVKLTDVYPDGRSMLITDGILRASLRNSFARPELLKPDQTYELTVDLWSTSLVFNKGHRIRVAVSSSNSPRFEPNPNTGATGVPRVATNTLSLSSERPSHILLPIYRSEPAAQN